MNKLKVATKALHDYLGNDHRGISLLEELTEIANAQRKRISALEETAAGTGTTIDQLRRERDSAKAEAVAANEELRRETAKRIASESRERALRAKIQSETEAEEEYLAEDSTRRRSRVDNICRLLRNVRKRFKKLPAVGRNSHGALFTEDIIKSFSHNEFACLGMVAAACAMVNVPVPIRAEHPMTLDDFPSKQAWELEISGFVGWYREAIVTSKLDDAIYNRYCRPGSVSPISRFDANLSFDGRSF